MTNWCYGTLRLSGKKEDVENFLLKGVIPVTRVGDYLNRDLLRLSKGNESFNLSVRYDDVSYLYIDGTHRGFIDSSYIHIKSEEDDKYVLSLQIRFANYIHAEELSAVAKRFNVYLGIKATEDVKKFSQTILIDDSGNIIADDQKDI